MYSSTHSLTSALDGGEWSASRPGRFTPRERARASYWIGGGVMTAKQSDSNRGTTTPWRSVVLLVLQSNS